MPKSGCKNICVIGLGYIGLPTAAMFASRRRRVTGVDVHPHVVETINNGQIHIIEPDLDIIVRSVVEQGYLRASTQMVSADAYLVAVPTPFKEGHQPDLTYVRSACESLAKVLKNGDLVILESTSPVGTTEQMAEWLAEMRSDLSFPQHAGEDSDIRLAHCPERVLPGKIMRELIYNDRLIGGMTPRCAMEAASLYRIFVEGQCIITNARTAEMAKLTENSFRDVNIAFANELSLICDRLDIDVFELVRLANHHPRVNILQPGPGVGGHCIAVDPWFIVSSAPEQARLIRMAREINDAKPEWVVQQVKQAVADFLQANPGKNAQQVSIACYGITFKPDIDDLRESPALAIAREISGWHNGRLMVVEPNIRALPDTLEAELAGLKDARKADIHVMLVDHRDFRSAKAPKGLIVDTRGVWNAKPA